MDSNFKNWLLLNTSSIASAESHLAKVKNFFVHYQVFDQTSINAFLVEKQSKWANTSLNIYVNAFKWYAKFLKIELEFPKIKSVNTKENIYITQKELQDILVKLPLIFTKYKKIQTLLLMMFESGMRPKNVISLKRSDFDFDNKNVEIKNTKTYSDKIAPLSNKLCDLLLEYFQQEAEVTNAFNLSKYTLKYVFQQINEKLGLEKKLAPYSMRRCYAHNLADNGADLAVIQKGMGHKDMKTTLVYLKVGEKEANDKIRQILNKKRRK